MLCDTLKKVLKLTKGWDAAREHALSAVNTDNRMRIWYKDDSMLTGLLFRCTLGNVDLENPVGEFPCSALHLNLLRATSSALRPGLIALMPTASQVLWDRLCESEQMRISQAGSCRGHCS